MRHHGCLTASQNLCIHYHGFVDWFHKTFTPTPEQYKEFLDKVEAMQIAQEHQVKA